MRGRSSVLLSVLLYGVGAAFAQVVALLSLNSGEYGQFSVLYLGYALGASFLLSTVSEAWARKDHAADAATYLATTSLVAVVFGVLTASAGALSGIALPAAAISGLGVYTSAMWSSIHYRLSVELAWRRLAISDATALVVSLLALVAAFATGFRGLVTVLAVWALYGAVAMVTSRSFALPSVRATRSWFRSHHQQIRALLPDSMLLDLGSVGTPLVLFPLMSAAPFGVYRAISNVAFPVRLILATVRPLLSRAPLSRARRLSTAAALAGASAVLGFFAGICLVLVALYLPILGVLAELRPYAVHAGVFVAATTFNTLIYIFCRIWATGPRLMLGRFLQTAIMGCAPLVGFFGFSVEGAITGFVVGALLICLVWFGVLRSIPLAPPKVS